MDRKIYTSPSASGLARAVTALQVHLHSELTWLQHSFGLASDGFFESVEKLTLTIPEVYVGGGEYRTVLPDDRLVSHAFYYADSAERVVSGEPYAGYRMACNVSLVVWMDLDRLNAEMGWGYAHRYTDELKQQALRAINAFPDFSPSQVHTKTKNVWSGWTIGRGVLYYGDQKEYALSQIGKHPEAGFRVYGVLTYEEPCQGGNTYFAEDYSQQIYSE